MTDTDLDAIALRIYWHLERGQEAKARHEITQTIAEADYMGNLLAIIHCDGGHYRVEYGTKKATDDAIEIVSRLKAELEELQAFKAAALKLTTEASVALVRSMK